MGAIAVHLSRTGPARRASVREMLDAAPHRGRGTRVELLGEVAVGVRGEPERNAAGLAREDGRIAIFHGTLDNERNLRSELESDGAPPPSSETPAATVLAALDRWGEGALARFRGSFAGAVTDGRRVHCFRDHFGTRPLFCHDAPAGFFAATEAKQVLAASPLSREPNLEHLHRVLFGGVDRSTAYRGVERLPKCSVSTAALEPGVRVREYWRPSDFVETADLGLDEAVAGTREALERAVRRTLTGEDAILLSGGLDSPALAAFAAGHQRAVPVQAVTAVYPDHPSADEREWTEMASEHLGLPLHAYEAEAGSLDDVERWTRALDGPVSVLSVPESAESYREARSVGARTVLTGEMAELLFENRAHLLDHLLSHGRLRAAGRLLGRLRDSGAGRLDLVRRVARAVAPPALMASPGDGGGPGRTYPSWIEAEVASSYRPDADLRSFGPRRRWVHAQTAPFQGPGVGFEVDEICAARCGVDVRRPFADVDLWEFALSLPAEVKFPDRRTKPLLRRAVRGLLPDELVDRRDKTYFDEFHLATADYRTLRRLLVESPHRIEGVDYGLLADRIEQADMGVYELQWARNVARVHAFLDQW